MRVEVESVGSSVELLVNDKLQRMVAEILTTNLERILAAKSSLDQISSVTSQKLSCDQTIQLKTSTERYVLQVFLELSKLP